MHKKYFFVLLLIIGLTACVSTKQPKRVEKTGTGILVIDKIDFAKDIVALKRVVRDECRLPEKLTKYIDKYAGKHYTQVLANIDLATVPADTEVLRVEIVEVIGDSEDAWSGRGFVAITGALQKNGKIFGDFKAKRIYEAGIFGYKGICSIMGRCVKTLGKDVGEWLKDPAKNDVLGDC